jgi:signal transduction histidine kinase
LEEARRAAVLEERGRIARDLHDTLAQGFTGIIIQLEAADEAHLAGDSETAAKHLRRAANLARQSLSDTRRCVHGLRPQALEQMPLDEALKRSIADATEGTTVRASVQIRGRVGDVPPDCQTHLLRIAQEALSNTLKHARATSFCVRLSVTERQLRLEFRDNGVGIGAIPHRHSGIGLSGIQERVREIGGMVNAIRLRTGGTRILVTVAYPGAILPIRVAASPYPESSSNRCDLPVAANSLACARS